MNSSVNPIPEPKSPNNCSPSLTSNKLQHAKQILYPPYFSSKPLSKTISDLIKAEPDPYFQASLTLQTLLLPQIPSQSHDANLLEAWNNLFKDKKPFFHPPEHFLKGQGAQNLLDLSQEAKKEAFNPLVKFIEDIENMLNQVKKSSSLEHKEQISKDLFSLQASYSGFQGQVSVLIVNINYKRQTLNQPYDQEFEKLSALLEPKALLFGDIFTEGPTAFRIPSETAKRIITEENNFKPYDSSIFQKIEQNEMAYSLYRLLDIPMTQKSPIVLIDDDLHFFEVSEVIPKANPIPENSNEWSENQHKTFCLQVLGTLLTTPSNPHFEGHILTSSDSFFNPALSLFENNYTIKSESPLYSSQGMDRPLPESLKVSLRNLSIDLLLLTWLKDLEDKRQTRQQLISNLPSDLTQPKNTISQALINSLKTKLSLIQKATSKNDKITPQNLLETVFPTLGAHYKTLRTQPENTSSNLQNPSELEIATFNSSQIPIQYLFQSLYKAYFQANPHVLDAFMEKYSERRMMKQLDPVEALRELLLYLEFNIHHLQNPRSFVDLWYKGKKVISQDYHDIWDCLFFTVENYEAQWFLTIDQYFPRDWTISQGYQPDDPSEVRGALISKRKLSQELQQDILDQNKSLKNQPLVRFPKGQNRTPVFFFKKEPELAGYEYAVTLFLREFGVEGVPFCELLVMSGPNKELYPTFLMQAIEGKTLDKVWLSGDEKFKNLDPHHTQMLILGSMLLNPEDGRASNFILTTDEKRIIPIHNDHVFVPGVITRDSGIIFKSKNTELLNKTILYCLPEMNKPIQESVIQKIINLNIDQLLSPWLAKLLQISENSHHLPNDEARARDGARGIFYRMGFPPNFIENLYKKSHKMQERLSANDKQLRPFDLLLELEPEVGKAYSEVFQQETTVYHRWTKLTGSLYKSAQNPKYTSLQLLEILEISPNELAGKYFTPKIGPAEALQIVASSSQVYKKVFNYMNVVKGRMKIEIEDAQKLQGETAEEEFIKKKLKDKDLQILALKNSSIKNFASVFASKETLKALILPGAKNLTLEALKILGKSFVNLESLIIGDNENLKALALEQEDFKNLKHLNVSNCPKLMYLRVESPALEALEIARNKNLKLVGLATKDLKYLDCQEEKIEIIYIASKGIKKVEVVGKSVQELEEKLVGIELWRKAMIVETVLVNIQDEKGMQDVLKMMFPDGIKIALEKK